MLKFEGYGKSIRRQKIEKIKKSGGKMCQNCSSDKLGVNLKSFAKLSQKSRLLVAMDTLPQAYLGGDYPAIVSRAILLGEKKVLENIFKEVMSDLENSKLDIVQKLHQRKAYGESFIKLLEAIQGSCEHELVDNVWLYDPKGQEFLLNFAKKSNAGLAHWATLVLEDLLSGEKSGKIEHWVEDIDKIKYCIDIFGLPLEKIRGKAEKVLLDWGGNEDLCTWIECSVSVKKMISGYSISEEKIREKAEQVFMNWAGQVKIDTLISYSETVKMFIERYGISTEKVHDVFSHIIYLNMDDEPSQCIKAIKAMDYPINEWKDHLQAAADELLRSANGESDRVKRKDMVEEACKVHKLLKLYYVITSEIGNACLKVLENKKSKNSTRDVLREATLLLKEQYEPWGVSDMVWYAFNRMPAPI